MSMTGVMTRTEETHESLFFKANGMACKLPDYVQDARDEAEEYLTRVTEENGRLAELPKHPRTYPNVLTFLADFNRVPIADEYIYYGTAYTDQPFEIFKKAMEKLQTGQLIEVAYSGSYERTKVGKTDDTPPVRPYVMYNLGPQAYDEISALRVIENMRSVKPRELAIDLTLITEPGTAR